MKFIFVTGGVISGLGKGITASSIGFLLKSVCDQNVTAVKIDPYLNLDAGTMSPFEHGETYVLRDGGETDLDLGNYERFLDICLTRNHNITTGKVYNAVIQKERRGDYLGKTVQIIPHVTNEIIDTLKNLSQIPTSSDAHGIPDITIVELGGTIGDLESATFVEAISQLINELPENDTCVVHVSLLPMITSGELKTKPTQHSLRTLRQSGIQPDFVCLRTETEVPQETLNKIQKLCLLKPEQICVNTNVPNIYFVPQLFFKQNLDLRIASKLRLNLNKMHRGLPQPYQNVIKHFGSNLPRTTVGIVGKYTGLNDSYLSLIRALEHASFMAGKRLEIEWICAENDSSTLETKLASVNAMIIPGGFGVRGIEGMINAAKYARENKVPTLGICLGMQVMCIEFARNVLGIKDANSEEFSRTENKIVHLLPENESTNDLGGTMRLGSKVTRFVDLGGPRSCVQNLYNLGESEADFYERYRHRYEINSNYREQFAERGLNFVAVDETGVRLEICELEKHPYYVGCQFHPEYESRFHKPHPLFIKLF